MEKSEIKGVSQKQSDYGRECFDRHQESFDVFMKMATSNTESLVKRNAKAERINLAKAVEEASQANWDKLIAHPDAVSARFWIDLKSQVATSTCGVKSNAVAFQFLDLASFGFTPIDWATVQAIGR